MPLSRRSFCLCLACAALAPEAFAANGKAVFNSPLSGTPARLIEPSLRVAKGGKTPQVALTFDACSGAVDQRILGLLVAERIPATIFVTARWLRKNAETVALFKDRSDLFQIENHGLNHLPAIERPEQVYGIPSAGSMEAVLQEVNQGALWIENAGLPKPRWFRGATALYTKTSMAAIEAQGFQIAGFSLNGDQGASVSASAAAHRIAAARDGDVVIAHINHPERPAGAGVADGIRRLKEKGSHFVMLNDPNMAITSTLR